MLEKLSIVVANATSEIENATTVSALNEVRVKYLGKSGEFTALMKGLKDVPPAEKPIFGKSVNEARVKIESVLKEREDALKLIEKQRKLKEEKIDVTEPSTPCKVGAYHPLSLVKKTISDIFIGMGFEVREGPEVETD